jgi:hypothetical protein
VNKSNDDLLGLWIEVDNQRGYPALGHNENKIPGSKQITELSAAEDWAFSLNMKLDREAITAVKPGDDPPDIKCLRDGSDYSVEIVELVDRDNLEQASRHQKNPEIHPPVSDVQQLWDKAKFHKSICETITNKVNRYSQKDLRVNALLVVCHERFLIGTDVREWLKSIEIDTKEVFQDIYLMLDYEPDNPERYPLYKVCVTSNGK